LAEQFRFSSKTLEGIVFLRKLRRAMRGDTAFQNHIMKGLGALALGYSQLAFQRQALGTQAWPERYPKQQGAKVNIAGIVSDFIKGKNPPSHRFDARPAGIDTKKLVRSLTPESSLKTKGFSVEIGSVEQNASAVQFGGESEQPLTKSVLQRLATFMKQSRGRIKRAKKASQPITAKDAGIQKLGFLFGVAKKKGVLSTKSIPRPYLGVTNELEDKMIGYLVEEFEEFDSGNSSVVKA
jgi:hypothetical protein